MCEHTPGPWTWERDPQSFEECTALSGPDGECVITLNDDYPGYPECGQHLIMEVSDADARLIAAAPDLLYLAEEWEKCRRRPGLCDACEHQKPHGGCVISDMVVAAIAKAKG